ncbi:MAG TPA: DNA repair protein RadC [Alphaproteobacteria bacterium]|nr:DNA repair protein RadC [Alphaproteobacteria bacterium]
MSEKPHYAGHRKRLRERFLKSSGEDMPDYELLELLLFFAQSQRDVKPLAKKLIERFGSFAGVVSAEPARLREIDGVKDGAVAAIKLAQASAKRLLRQEVLGRPVISSWQALLEYCQAAMARESTEQFRVLYLDQKNQLIADELQQKGTVNHTPVYPREIMKRALELAATAVILVHNHPSGDPSPSKADIAMTRDVAEAGHRLDIAVHDHVIIGRSGHASFKSLGLL